MAILLQILRYPYMKDKLKPLIKEAKKNAQKAIQLSLVTQLKEITAKFGEGSKKLEKKNS
jgi:hypothetical protein